MKFLAFLLVLLTGCASPEQYTLYLATQQSIETARHHADGEKYRALAAIANSGSDTAKVAAVMSLSASQLPASVVNLRPPQNEALQWAQILVPSLTNIAGFAYGARVSMNASNNAAAVAQSTNQAFLGMGQAIQAPAPAIIPQANVTTTTTNTHTQDNHSVDTHEMTLSGTGTLGSGSYATTSISANRTRTTTDSFNPVTTNTTTTTDNSVVNPAVDVPVVNPL